MYVAGCDIGSLTAKAVILKDEEILGGVIMPVKPSAAESALIVMQRLLMDESLQLDDISCICSTGYGRMEIPFTDTNMSEISCHGLGAFKAGENIRTIIDIGGQDCKAISIDASGRVIDFIMNDKCAAGTGRSLEMLAKTLGVPLEDLGRLSRRSRKPVSISSRCGIFMELEVLEALYRRKKTRDIARGIADAVAERAAALLGQIYCHEEVCITGGVSKNKAVVEAIEGRLGVSMVPLSIDHQLTGAYGAALYAHEYCIKNKVGETVTC